MSSHGIAMSAHLPGGHHPARGIVVPFLTEGLGAGHSD
jgi:hypothetical protein